MIAALAWERAGYVQGIIVFSGQNTAGGQSELEEQKHLEGSEEPLKDLQQEDIKVRSVFLEREI